MVEQHADNYLEQERGAAAAVNGVSDRAATGEELSGPGAVQRFILGEISQGYAIVSRSIDNTSASVYILGH